MKRIQPQVYVQVTALRCEWPLESCDSKAEWVTALDTGDRIFLCNRHAQVEANYGMVES